MNLTCQCFNILLTYHSNDTNYGSESFFQTATLVTSKIPPPPPPTPKPFFSGDTIVVLGLLPSFCLFACCFGLCMEMSFAATRKEAKKTKKIKKTPTTVSWISELREKTVEIISDVRFECCNFKKQIDKDGKESEQGAVLWVQQKINKTFGSTFRWPQILVPRTARIISVPMKNFKCGDTCTEFKPNCDVSPEDAANSYYTYQMCGENKIQVVRYVENDVTYVAGYCVYIRRPYEWDMCYNEMHIQNCYLGPEYIPKSDSVPGEVQTEVEVAPAAAEAVPEADASESTSLVEIPLLEDSQETELQAKSDSHKEHLRNLQLHFCEKKQDVVAIGCVGGVVRHFNWNILTKSYEPSYCETCRLEEWEESPPPYHMLNVWTEEDV